MTFAFSFAFKEILLQLWGTELFGFTVPSLPFHHFPPAIIKSKQHGPMSPALRLPNIRKQKVPRAFICCSSKSLSRLYRYMTAPSAFSKHLQTATQAKARRTKIHMPFTHVLQHVLRIHVCIRCLSASFLLAYSS
jgi:hypothetical protein